jgi:hypothetical protein
MKRAFLILLVILLCGTGLPPGRDSSYNQDVPGSPGCPYLAQSCAIFAAFNTPPTTAYKVAINNLVAALLANPANVWGKMDYLYVMAAADAQSALINWKNPGTATLTNVNSASFTANEGYNSDGSTSYLSAGVGFTSGGQLSQNSAALGGWLIGTASTNSFVPGQQNAGVYTLFGDSAGMGARLSTSATDTSATAGQTGYLTASRTAAAVDTLYVNGAPVATPNSTSTGSTGSGNIQILASATFFSPATSIAAIVHVGGAMTSQDVANACGAFGAYLVAVGGIVSAPCTVGAQAARAKNFTNSVGVVDPLGTSATAISTALSNMGISVVRTIMPYTGDGGGNYNYLAANNGTRFDFLWFGTSCSNSASAIAATIALENTFVTTYPGKLLTNEGLNETNNFPPCYSNTGATNNTTSTSSAVLHFAATPPEVESVGNYSYTNGGTINAGTGITVVDTNATIDPGSNYISCASCGVGFQVPITINAPNECIVAFTTTNSGAISSVTDTLSLSWALRATAGSSQPEQEFYALGPSSGGFPQTDTITFNNPAGFVAAGVIGIVNCNTSSPFDGAPITGSTDPLTISTSHNDTIVLAGFRMATTTAPTAGSGYTQQFNGFYTLNEYQTFTSTQSGLSVTITTGAGDSNGGIADAIVLNAAGSLPAIAPGTTVVSATGTTLTMSANAINGGVKSGDLIQFSAQAGPPTTVASVAASLLWQAAIYNATQADSTLTGANVQVANYTSFFGNTVPQPPSIAGTANYNNYHFYPNPGYLQPTTFVNNTMVAAFNPANAAIVGAPYVITEGGYCTPSPQSNAVDQTTQARLELNIYLDMFTAGVPYTTLYQIFDINTGDGSCFDNYGFYQSDLATIKVNGTAVKNMQTILNDSGGTALTFTPGQFNYSISGLPAAGAGGGFSQLLQKSNGTWEIEIWKEPTIWNDTTHTEVTPATSSLTISLPITATTVNVYDPITGSTPIATHSSVSSVSASLIADPLIIEVIP